MLQMMIADNDGVLDADNMFTERTHPLINLNSHLFTTLSLFFSWSGLQQEENSDILIGQSPYKVCWEEQLNDLG